MLCISSTTCRQRKSNLHQSSGSLIRPPLKRRNWILSLNVGKDSGERRDSRGISSRARDGPWMEAQVRGPRVKKKGKRSHDLMGSLPRRPARRRDGSPRSRGRADRLGVESKGPRRRCAVYPPLLFTVDERNRSPRLPRQNVKS